MPTTPHNPADAEGCSPLARSLAELWAVAPDLAAALDAAPGSEPTPRTGGKPLTFDRGRHLLILMHGSAGPYRVGEILPRLHPKGRLVVFESDPIRLLNTLAEPGIADALADGRLGVADDIARLEAALLFNPPLLGRPMLRIDNPAADLANTDAWREAAAAVDACADDREMDGRTARAITGGSARNVLRNARRIAADANFATLANRHAGRTAVLVAAGPSLRKNIADLAKYQNRVVIVAVQTALRALLAAGITPHYVCALDAHDNCRRFFEDLPEDSPTWLVAKPRTSPVLAEVHPGPIAYTGSDELPHLFGPTGHREGFDGATTVAHQAFRLIEHLGCRTAVLIGQDLGFSGGAYYVPGTSHERIWRAELGPFNTIEMRHWEWLSRDKKHLVRLADVHGQPMFSEGRMTQYLRKFEQIFANSSLRVIDATEGGAAKQFTEVAKLADVLAVLPDEPVSIDPPTDPSPAAVAPAIKRLAQVRGDALESATLARDAATVLATLDDLRQKPRKFNEQLARYDTLRHRMAAFSNVRQLVGYLIQDEEVERQFHNIAASDPELSPVEQQRLAVERDRAYLAAYANAAQQVAELLNDESSAPARKAA
jgi:hypothetical protein